MFVIEVVHIQCSKFFEGLECAVMFVALCTIKTPWSYSIRVGKKTFKKDWDLKQEIGMHFYEQVFSVVTDKYLLNGSV